MRIDRLRKHYSRRHYVITADSLNLLNYYFKINLIGPILIHSSTGGRREKTKKAEILN